MTMAERREFSLAIVVGRAADGTETDSLADFVQRRVHGAPACNSHRSRSGHPSHLRDHGSLGNKLGQDRLCVGANVECSIIASARMDSVCDLESPLE